MIWCRGIGRRRALLLMQLMLNDGARTRLFDDMRPPVVSLPPSHHAAARLKSLSGLKSVNVAGTVIPVSNNLKMKILGVTIDSNLTMEPHTKTLSISCFYHIRSLKQILSSLNDSIASSVASSLVSSCFDYANCILYGASLKNINRLQRIQHSLARVVTHQSSHALPSATALLKQLHWLPVEWRIRFKLTTVTFKALHTGRPPNLTDLSAYQVSALIGFSQTRKAAV